MVNSHYHPREAAHRIASADDNNPIVYYDHYFRLPTYPARWRGGSTHNVIV